MPYDDTTLASSALTRVRFAIDKQSEFLTDNEINYLLDKYEDDENRVIVTGLNNIISQLASQCSYTLGPYRIELKERLANFKMMLKEAKQNLSGGTPWIDAIDNPVDTIFDLDMMSNESSTSDLLSEDE